jgi:hypothetical protein
MVLSLVSRISIDCHRISFTWQQQQQQQQGQAAAAVAEGPVSGNVSSRIQRQLLCMTDCITRAQSVSSALHVNL